MLDHLLAGWLNKRSLLNGGGNASTQALHLNPTRRQFIGGSLAGISSPVFASPAAAFASPFSYEWNDSQFVIESGSSSWQIHQNWFGKPSQLRVRQQGSDIHVKLLNGRFPGTNKRVHFEFQIIDFQTPTAILQVKSRTLGIDTSTSLKRWIAGKSVLQSNGKLLRFHALKARRTKFLGRTSSLDRDWNIRFSTSSFANIFDDTSLENPWISLGRGNSQTNSGTAICCNSVFFTKTNIHSKNLKDVVLKVDERHQFAAHLTLFDDHASNLVLESIKQEDCIQCNVTLPGREELSIAISDCRFSISLDNTCKIVAAGLVEENRSFLTFQSSEFKIDSASSNQVLILELSESQNPSLSHAFHVSRSRLTVDGVQSGFYQPSVKHEIFVQTSNNLPGYKEGMLVASTANEIPFTVPTKVVSEVVCQGCSVEGKPAGINYFATRIMRSEDLLDLGFEFYNFSLGKEGNALVPRDDVPGPSLIIVNFPPQHIEEDAFAEAMGCEGESPGPTKIPIGSKISSKSRLVFEYPKNLGPLNLDSSSILEWEAWLPKGVDSERHPNLIAAPKWDETSIEVPSGLIMQQGIDTRWRAKSFEDGKDGRFVLFNADLLPNSSFDPNEPDFRPRARVVPVWTSAFSECGVLHSHSEQKAGHEHRSLTEFLRHTCRRIGLHELGAKDPTDKCEFETPPEFDSEKAKEPRKVLSERDLREIVRLSHDITLCAEPPKAHHLLLSSLGAWADFEGYWPKNKARACYSNLQKWRHRTTQGRDQFVKTVRRGFLYPFGHRILLVEETNRKLHQLGDHTYAALKKKWYVVVEQQEVKIDPARTLPDQNDDTFKMCFRSVRIVEPSSPNLDPVDENVLQPVPGQDGTATCVRHFFGTVCGEQYHFNVVAKDWRNREIKFSVPLLYISDLNVEVGDIETLNDGILSRYYNDAPNAQSLAFSFSDLSGQLAALAPGYQEGDTDFEVARIRFKGVGQRFPVEFSCGSLPDYLENSEERCAPILDKETEISAPFYPVVEAVEASAPTLSRGAPAGGGVSWVDIVDPSITQESFEIVAIKHPNASADADKVDLNAEAYPNTSFQLPFHQDNDSTGGVSGPTPDITAWSRIKGPLGIDVTGLRASDGNTPKIKTNVSRLRAGNLSPSDYFNLDAKILGVIPLSEIISGMGLDSTTPALLDFFNIGGDTPDSTGFVYDWDTPYGGFDFGILKFGPNGDEQESKIVIAGGIFLELIDGPKPRGFISGSISDFFVTLEVAGNGIKANFDQVALNAPIGEKVKFDVDIADVKFIGPIMEFIQKLKESLGFGDGFDVVLNSDSVSAILGPFELPGIGFGVFSMSQMSFFASCDIYFKGNKPVLFTFAFSSRAKPFTLAVALLGGRGYFLIAIDTSGVQKIEAGLEFGAIAEFNFGGFAHGNLYIMGGVFYSSKRENRFEPVLDADGNPKKDKNNAIIRVAVSQTVIAVQIYVRAGGSLSCFGFITVSLDVHLGLTVSKRGSETVAYGTATIEFSVKIGFFKKSFPVTFSKELPGSSSGDNRRQRLQNSARVLHQKSLSPASPATVRSSFVEEFVGRKSQDLSQAEQTGGVEPAVFCEEVDGETQCGPSGIAAMSENQFRYYWYAFEENRRHRL